MNYRMKSVLEINSMRVWLSLILTFVLGGSLLAADIPDSYDDFRAKDYVLVYDYADMLTDAEEQRLNSKFNKIKDQTSNVFVVVTHPDFLGDEPFAFATEFGDRLGVGTSKNDNGVVIAIKPKTSKQRGEAFIAVGYGLEGAIPDVYAKRIVDNELIPHFKKNLYYGGIVAGVNVMSKLAMGEINEYMGDSSKSKSRGVPIFAILFLLFTVGGVVGRMGIRTYRYARLNDMSFWAAWALLSQASQTHTGRYDDFTGGRGHFGGWGGGFGGGGGGGFGGFGGGGFGGGGAGGSW